MVGQPMGFKSSFPIMALTHHVVVMEAARIAGVENFTEYVILGDDIVIGNKLVAEAYKQIMKKIGVMVNNTKSVVPGPVGVRGAEFCSRLALNGLEVTKLPIRACLEAIQNSTSIPSLWNTLIRRNLFVGQTY